jgi:hypothetical protein
MNINWVLADTVVLDPVIDIDVMKEIGPLWGSWRTWRSCQTDNVICHDFSKSEELIKRNFHNTCNFYIPSANWVSLDRPDSVNLYEGQFVDEFQPEEIIAMHLTATVSDVVLLLGFDWQDRLKNTNRLLEHRFQAYRALITHVINDNPEVQWVLVDHPGDIMKSMSKIPNLTKDTMEMALSLQDI